MAIESRGQDAALSAYVSLFAAMPLPTVVLDPAGRVQLWNAGAEGILGWKAEEVLGRKPPGVPQDEREACDDQHRRALAGEILSGVASRRMTKVGETLDVHVAVAPLRDQEGAIVGVVQVFEDISGRRRVEAALEQSEERFRTIVSTAFEGIWLIGNDGQTVYANGRMAEMLGSTPEQLQERAVYDFVFPGDDDAHAEHIRLNLRGQVEQFDARFRREDGSELLVLACTSPVHDSEGKVVGALGLFTDITERVSAEREREDLLARERQARAEAEEARQRLKLLADASALLASSLDYETTLNSLAQAVVPSIADWCSIQLLYPDGTMRQVVVVHPDPAKVRLAREFERMYPYDPGAPTGVPHVMRTGEAELIPEISDSLLETILPDPRLLTVLRGLGLKSSMILPLETRGRMLGAISLVTAESGRRYTEDDVALAEVLARRAALAIDNATLFQQARRAAAEQEAILAQMTDGVIISDPDGIVTFMNAAAQRLYGADFTGQSLVSYAGTMDLSNRRGERYTIESLPIARALAGEKVVAEEARLIRSDGSELFLQRSATAVRAPDGGLLGAVITVRDVSGERALELQKDAFLSAAAHDLRTPLTGMKGMAQVLQRRLTRGGDVTAESIVEGLRRIEQNASRMASIINELIDLSRPESGERLQLNLQRADLVGLVRKCVVYHREAASGQRVDLAVEVETLFGTWDCDRIERAVMNLLSNATKYSPELTPITVTLGEDWVGGARWATISVSDRGIGVPPQDLPRIFERFHRAGNVGPETLGTGIGLAGARQIVEQHGGTIDVESVEGRGSTFTIRLPIVENVAEAEAPEADRAG